MVRWGEKEGNMLIHGAATTITHIYKNNSRREEEQTIFKILNHNNNKMTGTYNNLCNNTWLP